MKNTKTLAELTAGATGALALLATRVALAAEKTAEKAAEKGSIDAKAPGSTPMESADGVAGAAGSAGSAGGAAAPAAPDPEAIRQMVETTVQNQDPTSRSLSAALRSSSHSSCSASTSSRTAPRSARRQTSAERKSALQRSSSSSMHRQAPSKDSSRP